MATRSGFDQVRENLRLQQVYNVFVRYGMEMIFDTGILGIIRRRMQLWIYHPDRPFEQVSTAVKVRLMLQELGPTYVKMGQIVSSRADVLPPDWEVEFTKLQSDVPPFPYEDVQEIIQEELKESPQFLTQLIEAFRLVPKNVLPPSVRHCVKRKTNIQSKSQYIPMPGSEGLVKKVEGFLGNYR